MTKEIKLLSIGVIIGFTIGVVSLLIASAIGVPAVPTNVQVCSEMDYCATCTEINNP